MGPPEAYAINERLAHLITWVGTCLADSACLFRHLCRAHVEGGHANGLILPTQHFTSCHTRSSLLVT